MALNIVRMLLGPAWSDSTTLPAWSALPGGRLEFGASGFVIQLLNDPRVLPYLLIDPDGRLYARSAELQSLKTYAEQLARDRAEFDALPRPRLS